MFLKRIYIKNFRNHEETQLNFRSRLVFFIGNNGEGKTNLLESISLLSYLKSFRESDQNQLLRWDTSDTFIRAEFESEGNDYLFEYGIEHSHTKRKKLKVNGEEFKKISDYVGYFRSIVMSPPDILIIEDGNVERRRFLDAFISSTNRYYLKQLIEYERLIKQRNAALKKENASDREIGIWDEPIIGHDAEIREIRTKTIETLAGYFHQNLLQLSSGKDPFYLTYKPNVSSKEEHRQKLFDNLRKDKAIGYTSCGNHRDTLPIGFDDKDLSGFGSQGQKRSAVIALKTACFQMIRDTTGEAPVLLIDDIIRELDVKRREYFVNLISECGQAFFTTTDLEGINEYVGNLTVDKEIYQIESGKVKELTGL
ncbi:DNA replication/repair protein RecF [Leptospira levettii]|uniref:DNA replication/repair protein RecF n=1 Tax=Leptospira levettii TaxID=2023178 RepID=UPI000C2AB528|nr:DNA replication and repair protein RecF [Leptospira levettii]PJZ88821.1 DNA replication and repair protein RecF [Leptospira levettii]